MNILGDLWDEAHRECAIFESQRRFLPPIVWGAVLIFVWFSDQRWHPQQPDALTSGCLMALAVAVITVLVLRRPRTGAIETRVGMVLLASLGLAALVTAGHAQPTTFGLACVAMTLVLSSRLGLFGLGMAAALAAVLLLIAVGLYHEPPYVPLLGGVGLAWMYIGPLQARRSQRIMRLEAAVEERARLAREIHDVLAHTLSALSVQLEGARLLTAQHPGDPRAVAALERSQRLVAAGMEETRQAVAALRGDVLPAPDALRRLADDFQRESGVPCRLEVVGTPVPLGPDASQAIYRAAQEALTNIRKHADASEVTMVLRHLDRRAELTVSDRGGPRRAPTASGYGLTGIRERTELLGGELEAGPTPDGFRVRLSVPA